MLEAQQQVRSMREWVTFLVTVTLATSSFCKYWEDSGSNLNEEYVAKSMSSISEEESFQMSKGQEKVLKDYQEMKKKKYGKDRKKQSSEFVVSEEKDSRKRWSDSSANEREQRGKPNMWTNYARGKYGVEESVDLSILRTTVRKAAGKHTKPVVKSKKGKDKSREVAKKFTKKVGDKVTIGKLSKKKSASHSEIIDEMEFDMPSKSKEINEKIEKFVQQTKEKKEPGKTKKKSESHSEIIDENEFDMPSESSITNKKGGKNVQQQKEKELDKTTKQTKKISESDNEIKFNLFSKYVDDKEKGKFSSYEINSDQNVSNKKIKPRESFEGQTYETSDTKHKSIDTIAADRSRHQSHVKSSEVKVESKATVTKKKSSKTKPPKKKKKKVQKAKTESEEEYAYDDDKDLEGHTYETSNQQPKAKHVSDAKSEEDDHDEVEESSKLKKSKENFKKHPDSEGDSYVGSHTESEIKGKPLKTKDKKIKLDSKEPQSYVKSYEVTKKKGKETKTKTKNKKPKKSGKEKKRFTTTPYVKSHTAKADLKKELKRDSQPSFEEEISKEKRETVDPLEMSTEELFRYNEMLNQKTTVTQRTTIITTELLRPTTLKPSGTDHWICRDDVKSQTIEINWDNYDSRGQKRMEEKPIEPVFRNKMKRFSTKELKGTYIHTWTFYYKIKEWIKVTF